MTGAAGDLLESRRGSAIVVASISVVFLAVRALMLAAREPFFDELFTIWISEKPYAAIVAALRHDSGPPLYYFLVHTLGITSVIGARLLSLLCASISYVLVIRTEAFGRARFVAAALLAVFPPAVLFAVDARSYALSAMFVTIAVVLLAEAGEDARRVYLAAISLALAAWSHYYGVLFFPILLVPRVQGSLRERISSAFGMQRIVSLVLALVLFAPGVVLARMQPREAMAWMASGVRWPDALLARPPWVLLAAAAIVAIVAARRVNRFTWMTIIPIAAAAVFALAGRGVYFPLRFESVLAVPLLLAIAASLQKQSPLARLGLVTPLLVGSLAVSYVGIVEHIHRPPDEYRVAARWVAEHVPPKFRVVATGYLYLETVTSGRPDAQAFPSEQAVHPGWRAQYAGEPPPGGMYVWVGEATAPELTAIAKQHQVEPLFIEPRALVALVR